LAETQAGVTGHPDFSRLDRAVKRFILTHRVSREGVPIASLPGKPWLVEVNLFLGEQVSVGGKFVTGEQIEISTIRGSLWMWSYGMDEGRNRVGLRAKPSFSALVCSYCSQ
jgi:hypothetical protein